jgi:hypothetical protein
MASRTRVAAVDREEPGGPCGLRQPKRGQWLVAVMRSGAGGCAGLPPVVAVWVRVRPAAGRSRRWPDEGRHGDERAHRPGIVPEGGRHRDGSGGQFPASLPGQLPAPAPPLGLVPLRRAPRRTGRLRRRPASARGSASDLAGGRLVFLAGLAVFTAASRSVSAEARDQLLAALLTTSAGSRADPAVFVHLGVPLALVGAGPEAVAQAWSVARVSLTS